jgi:hypothetical protein
MTGQELAFLGFGLVVGLAGGALLVATLRRRSLTTPGVRVTVTPAVLPRRPSATLVEDGVNGSVLPARGGPGDANRAASPARPLDTPWQADRTSVRPAERLVPVPVFAGVDPLLDALRAGGRPTATALMEPPAGANPILASGLDGGIPATAEAGGADIEPAAAATEAAAPSGPCAELRVAADERCEVAARARVEAERAQDTLRAAQRSYDEHLSRAEDATHAADPRTIRAAKDAAQQAFRNARAVAQTAEAIDAAARDWLTEVNRINQEQRSSSIVANREREAARALASSLDRLTVEADAARIAAETADEACLNARQAAADCDEGELEQAAAPAVPAVPSGAPGAPWIDEDTLPRDGAATALGTGTAPTVFRLLQGDRDTLVAVVDRLAGSDPEQRRHWQLAMSDLVDAILATAIEGSALEFPEDHLFWGPFTVGQSRDIVAALASLGYRFDGLGGWQDGRVPSQRDLSLALGYAGLDPMRMRHWPNEAEMAGLFREIRVAAPEYLAVSAGDLTLGELVTMLGPRADGLTDVWNAWGRIRPLLLEER